MYKILCSKSPYALLAILLAFLDQISKKYFVNLFSGFFFKGLTVTSYLNFVHAWNQGISFGLFHGIDYSNIIFLSLSSLITLILLVLLFRANDKLVSISYSFIIGGAIGNIIDRVNHGAVFDFIDFHIGSYHWPAFNLADSFVCIGAILLVFYSLREKINCKVL